MSGFRCSEASADPPTYSDIGLVLTETTRRRYLLTSSSSLLHRATRLDRTVHLFRDVFKTQTSGSIFVLRSWRVSRDREDVFAGDQSNPSLARLLTRPQPSLLLMKMCLECKGDVSV